MSQDVGRRRSRGGPEVESYGKDHGTDSQQVGQIVVEESPIRLPDPKRRRAPSPSQPAAASPSDHGATRQTSEPATATTGDTTPGKAQDADTVVGNSQETHPGSSSTYFHPPGLRNERQLPSSSRTHSVSARPETSPSTQSNSVGLARLPSLSSIAQDLPVNTFPSHQSPRGLSSPISTRSNHSRHSISSRGSSPHASSSSSSSSAGRRRYGSHVTDGAVSRSASQVPEFRYELVIHQQPGTAAAAGLSPPALSRLPIVPSPILQLRVTNAEGVDVGHRYILQNLPYLVCSCSLVSADEDQAPIDFATEEQPLPASVAGVTLARRPSQPLAMMCGTRVYSSSEAAGLDNQPGVYFIFWDISVRQEGEYRLKFSLVEALPGSPTLTTVISEPFRVVGRAEFPGTVEIATEWTRHMHRQGLNIYLPALGTSSSALASSITRS